MKINLKPPTDDSVIDVTGQSIDLSKEYVLHTYLKGVPEWKSQKIIQRNSVLGCTNEQRKFYSFFKNSFLNGTYYDLEGNLDYAVLLLFDLIYSYKSPVPSSENHRNLSLLKNQLESLHHYYPQVRINYRKTAMYFLIKFFPELKPFVSTFYGEEEEYASDKRVEIISVIDKAPIASVKILKIGNKYKEKLALTDEETEWINELPENSFGNSFIKIEECKIETLKLYLKCLHSLDEDLKKQNSSFTSLMDLLYKKIKDYSDECTSFPINPLYKERLYKYIFNNVEKYVRNKYMIEPVNTAIAYVKIHSIIVDLYEEKIASKLDMILKELQSSIVEPDELTEIELNCLDHFRWETEFTRLSESIHLQNKKDILSDLKKLIQQNRKSKFLSLIYLKTFQLFAKYNQLESLKFYIHHIYIEKLSNKPIKPIAKKYQNLLFKNLKQKEQFDIIVQTLLNDKNLEQALENVSGLYEITRKKINLDKKMIQEAHDKHIETVNQLNEYLKDEEIIEIKVESKKNVQLGEDILSELLSMFEKRNFSLSNQDVSEFSKSKNQMKNSLINSINERYYEILDDNLIEENSGNYTIDKNYFLKIRS